MKATFPSISIVTPSFNQGQFIQVTIDSVLDQNYPNLEYLVADGGSTDDTVAILRSYGKKLRWFSQPDKGQTDAINKGMAQTSGEIVLYLNSDDVLLPGALKTIATAFQRQPEVQWLTGDYAIIDEHGQPMQSFVAAYKRWWRQWPTKSTLSIANYIAQPSTAWRRSAMAEVGPFKQSLRYCMDLDYWFRLMERYPLLTLSQPLSAFRIHSQSKGGSRYPQQFAEEHRVVVNHQSNQLLRWAHWCHAQAIVLAYRFLK